MSDREEFEKAFPVPANVYWDENRGLYDERERDWDAREDDYQNAAFDGWQAARATPALPQGVEEWADTHGVRASLFDPDVLCVAVCDLMNLLSGMAIVPVERLKYLNDHHHATESGVGLARLALSRGDTQRAIEALNSTSEKLDSILDVLAAAKEKQS